MASDEGQSSKAASRDQSPRSTNNFDNMDWKGEARSGDSSEANVNGNIASEKGDGDLFGDEGDGGDEGEEEPFAKPGGRKLNDSELDSGDDEGRQDRVADTIEDFDDEPAEEQVVRIYPCDIGRMAEPDPSEGELYAINLPPFLGLKPENYDPETYEIPAAHHGANQTPTAKFSPFSVASTTAFWRHDPEDPSKLQSNTRIVRWSDGSLTLQIASQPREHYRVSTTALRQEYGKSQRAGETHEYNPAKDSHHFLGAPHAKSEVIRLIHPFSAAMKVLPSGEQTDEAVISLQKSLAAAEAVHDPIASIRHVKEDPELAKKRAELAEKEKLRAERRRQALFERETGRKEKVLGRRGLGGRGAVGLTIDNLEDEDGMPTAKARARKPSRRGDIYSDDEDDGYARGRTKEDEYDQDDGFLAASDEEPEIFDDDDVAEEDADADDLEVEGTETVTNTYSRTERQETPKRPRPETEEKTTMAGSPHTRKKRRVIDDDDEDE